MIVNERTKGLLEEIWKDPGNSDEAICILADYLEGEGSILGRFMNLSIAGESKINELTDQKKYFDIYHEISGITTRNWVEIAREFELDWIPGKLSMDDIKYHKGFPCEININAGPELYYLLTSCQIQEPGCSSDPRDIDRIYGELNTAPYLAINDGHTPISYVTDWTFGCIKTCDIARKIGFSTKTVKRLSFSSICVGKGSIGPIIWMINKGFPLLETIDLSGLPTTVSSIDLFERIIERIKNNSIPRNIKVITPIWCGDPLTNSWQSEEQ
jgi:hypothetical protein